MSDPLLAQTDDDGDITIPVGEDVTTTNGFETADYLSLFGGNLADDGTKATERLQWWGNFTEPDTERHQRSSFQALIESAPLTSALLPRLARSAEADLAWKVSGGYVDSLNVEVTVPARNSVSVVVNQVMNGETVTSRMIVPYGGVSA